MGKHVLAAHLAGLFERRSRALHDFLGNADELAGDGTNSMVRMAGHTITRIAVGSDLLLVAVMRWISYIRRCAERVRSRNPDPPHFQRFGQAAKEAGDDAQ